MAEEYEARQKALHNQSEALAKLAMELLTAFLEGKANFVVQVNEIAGMKTTFVSFAKKP